MKLKIDLTEGKIKKNVFFISDFHLFHNNVIRFDNRPFKDVHEMHSVLIDNWNDVVGEDDIVIYLGDISFAKADEKSEVNKILNKLNGKIHFIIGNHDKFHEIVKNPRFESVNDYLEVKIIYPTISGVGSSTLQKEETLFCCMHYPIFSWNKGHHGSWMIHGHCHMNLFNEEDKWQLEMDKFSRYIPTEELEEYNLLINKKHYYNRRVVDVGCMGSDFKPISFLDILKLEPNKQLSLHH